MAHFEGVVWANNQLRYVLKDKELTFLGREAQVHAVTRSIHYGLFLVFEGIRFFCRRDRGLEIVVVNWDRNMERFREGMAFNLGQGQQGLLPTADELKGIFVSFFRQDALRPFFEEMAQEGAQGYLRPFTIDEKQDIGVTFPDNPCIRAVMCRYDSYLGEPFDGVVVPTLVRATGINRTGCLKLGINYLMSVKAVDKARSLVPGAGAALFLDDNVWRDLRDREITEWDSSCCLIGLKDGSVVKIPESSLILPSVTIQGLVALLRRSGVRVEERTMTYGELLDRCRAEEIVTVCSVGTAGILNRCHKLTLTDMEDRTLAEQISLEDHPLFDHLGQLAKLYWGVYQGTVAPPEGVVVERIALSP